MQHLSPYGIATAFFVFLLLTALLVLVTRGATRQQRIGLYAFVLSLLSGTALAADGAAGSTSVDFAPLVQILVGTAATVLSGVVTIGALWVRHYLKARFGIELDAQARSYVQDAADRAAGLVKAQLERHVAGGGLTVDVHNAALAGAVDLLVEQVPDGLTRLGLTSTNVRQMLLTRLAAHGILPPDAAPSGTGLAA